MGRWSFIATRSARLTALLVLAPLLLGATAYPSNEPRLAFLSNSQKDQPPAAEIPALTPMPDATTFDARTFDAKAFDGRWIFTGAGCRGAGPVSALIRSGKVIVRGGGGNVTPDGIIHTVGAGRGLTLTAEGRLSGDSGSGTYDRSDGCSGTWIGVKQRR